MELEKITLEQLEGDQRELAELIGINAYRKLLSRYAGCAVYIGKPERITKQLRDAEICRKFNGSNYRQLAKEYHLSEITIRKIVSRHHKKVY